MKIDHRISCGLALLTLAVHNVQPSTAFAQVPAVTAPPGQGQLNASALDEIAAMEQEKASFTQTQRKLDSQLIFALKQSKGEAIAQGRLPNLRIGAQADAQGMVEVDIAGTITPDLL